MANVRLLAIDLDGTLLSTHNGVSRQDSDAIRKALSQGIKFIPASGRHFEIIPDQVKDLSPSYVISKNGALIYKGPSFELVRRITMDKKACLEIINWIYSLQINVMIMAESLDRVLRTGFNAAQVTRHFDYMKGRENSLTPDFFEQINSDDFDFDKFSFRVECDQHQQMILDLRKSYPQFNIMNTDKWAVEFCAAECSKGEALQWICEKEGIDPQTVAAIGDSENDISMLQYAGYSFAMANSYEHVKTVADEVTLANTENGVSHAIYRILDN